MHSTINCFVLPSTPFKMINVHLLVHLQGIGLPVPAASAVYLMIHCRPNRQSFRVSWSDPLLDPSTSQENPRIRFSLRNLLLGIKLMPLHNADYPNGLCWLLLSWGLHNNCFSPSVHPTAIGSKTIMSVLFLDVASIGPVGMVTHSLSHGLGWVQN